MTEAVILAGGLGTRLRSAVADLPKAMAPVAGRPFLAYLLRHLEENEVRRVVLAVGYRREAIQDFFGSRYGAVRLDYSVEQEPLGTGGGLLQALPLVEGQFAFVVNGDTFLRLDYGALAAVLDNEADADLVVALRSVPDASRYGRALVEAGRIRGFTARGTAGPGLINAGCYLVRRDIFERYPMPMKFSWEQDFLEARTAEIRPVAFPCDAPFIDIGVPEAFQEAQTLIPAWVNANPDAGRPSSTGRWNDPRLGEDLLWREVRIPRFVSPVPALFLDRDGVIVEEKLYLSDPENVELLPGIVELIQSARKLGMALVEVTNQAGIGRGYFSWSDFVNVENQLTQVLSGQGVALDAVFACPYHPQGQPPYAQPGHPWRKPNPGMLLEAARLLNLDLCRSVLAGDNAQDLEAARAAGLAVGIHVLTGHGRTYEQNSRALASEDFMVHVVANAGEAVAVLGQLGQAMRDAGAPPQSGL